MRRTLTLLASATALVLAAPLAASAATSCNIVPDKADDTTVVPGAGAVVKARAVDIRAVDVATGRKTLVLVLRLTSTNPAGDPATPNGVAWNASFAIGDAHYDFGRSIARGGAVTDTATTGGRAIRGVNVKVSDTAVTWTVPRASIGKLTRRAELTGFYGAASTTGFTDYAPDGGTASRAKYVDGTRSCVKAK